MKWNLPAHVQSRTIKLGPKGRKGGNPEEEEEKEPRHFWVSRGRRRMKGQLTRKCKGKYTIQWTLVYLQL